MKTFIFSISSSSGGGKTTISKALQEKFPNSKALFQDDRNYDSDSGIKDICEFVENGADVNLWDMKRFSDDIKELIVQKIDYIILDYSLGKKQKQIGPYLDYSIYIDTPLDVALARRIIRDYDENSIKNIFEDMKYYLDRGRNAYLYGRENVDKEYDYIVDGTLSVKDIVENIYEKIITLKNN